MSQALGLKSFEWSADYIQLYSGDVDVLTQSKDQVQKTAAHILEGIQLHSKREGLAPPPEAKDERWWWLQNSPFQPRAMVCLHGSVNDELVWPRRRTEQT